MFATTHHGPSLSLDAGFLSTTGTTGQSAPHPSFVSLGEAQRLRANLNAAQAEVDQAAAKLAAWRAPGNPAAKRARAELQGEVARAREARDKARQRLRECGLDKTSPSSRVASRFITPVPEPTLEVTESTPTNVSVPEPTAASETHASTPTPRVSPTTARSFTVEPPRRPINFVKFERPQPVRRVELPSPVAPDLPENQPVTLAPTTSAPTPSAEPVTAAVAAPRPVVATGFQVPAARKTPPRETPASRLAKAQLDVRQSYAALNAAEAFGAEVRNPSPTKIAAILTERGQKVAAACAAIALAERRLMMAERTFEAVSAAEVRKS